MKTLYETCEQIPQVCSTNGGNEAMCLTQDGKVLMLQSGNNWKAVDQEGNNFDGEGVGEETKIPSKCRNIDSFVGIVIKYVASAPNSPLICMLTHRGILITKGKYFDLCS